MEFEHGWLGYTQRDAGQSKQYLCSVYSNDASAVVKTAVKELQLAAEGLYGIMLAVTETAETATICLMKRQDAAVGCEGYSITESGGKLVITSAGEGGLLYGAFALIRAMQTGKALTGFSVEEIPANPLRMLNHWDNMDNSIERGYSGQSFFFKDHEVIVNERTHEYARLVSSVGINAVVINNVNVKDTATMLITPRYFDKLRAMSEIFADYNISLYLSLNFAAPIEVGGLASSDPLDAEVAAWWQAQMKTVYENLPKLGGFLVKADSEGRPGPFTYGRTHADGANVLARAVAPYCGKIIWRCFVYNCQQDWRDKKTDRARSAYDNFMPLDGKFEENVILQIKNGPMDFQVREPVLPLFGGLKKTNQMLEVQIAQEYTGQQRHLCYLIPLFKNVLDFRTYCKPDTDTVKDIIAGRTFGQKIGGMAAVSNTGDDANWTGHDLAAANLFGFGRLAFNTELSAEEIAEEWIKCTFGSDETVVSTIQKMLMMSWPTYEKYNAPLGIGWMVNPGIHYGPNVDGYEYDRWGTYHRADHLGIGVDRTMQGTGFAQLYHTENADKYESLENCPDELLLFFHHVPYTHKLHSGKTVIQHIYDTHFEGAEGAEELLNLWNSLEGRIRPEAFERTKKRFEHQRNHAKEWRDQINTYFYRKSMIPDEKGRTIY